MQVNYFGRYRLVELKNIWLQWSGLKQLCSLRLF
jgi:hypothetical protein